MREDTGRADHKINGDLLYGCEVCWTCKYFRFESMDCRVRLNPKTFIKSNLDNVSKPEWWRCAYWTEPDRYGRIDWLERFCE